ncbi:MAG: hypothetical protein K9M19_08580 [Candidatus Marinimicrobia bacterium]|nr:hypothetical protein [Candidatus Neomarinimicrobiota bacterium]
MSVQLIKRNINVHGMEGVHLAPDDRVPGEKLPLLVFFHGYGADMHDLVGLAPYFQIRAHIICLQGSRSTPFGGRAWFDLAYLPSGELQFDESQALQAGENAAAVVNALLQDENLPVSQLIVGGFSQGAAIAMLVSLLSPEKTNGVLVMSGRRPERMGQLIQDAAALGHFKVFVGHGIHDPTLPIMNGRNLQEFWRQLPVKLTYREYPMGHEINPQELADINQWLQEFKQEKELTP